MSDAIFPLSPAEIIAGLERIEETMREKWEDYGVDILASARAHIAALEAKLAEAQALVARVEKDRAADLVIARELERERLAALAEPVLHYLDWMHRVQSGQTGAAVTYTRTIGEVRADIEAFATAIRKGGAP